MCMRVCVQVVVSALDLISVCIADSLGGQDSLVSAGGLRMLNDMLTAATKPPSATGTGRTPPGPPKLKGSPEVRTPRAFSRHTHTHTHTHIRMHECMHGYTALSFWVFTWMCVYVCICVDLCTCVCVDARARVCVCVSRCSRP